MALLNELTLDQMVDQALEMQNLSENDLLVKMGTIMDNNGYQVLTAGPLLSEVHQEGHLSVKSIVAFHTAKELSTDDPKEEGKRFIDRLLAQIKHEICTNKNIYNWLVNDNSDLKKEAIKKIISIALTTLGLAVAGWVIALLVVAIAFLLKQGYIAFCSPLWDTEGKPV
ncbi:MAG: hypothetical protein V2A54_16375 [Bacteroidota bacterium]